MSEFRALSELVLASPQIALADIATARDHGVTLIINNRPDGEDPLAPQSAEVESAAQQAGIQYEAIPVGHSGFSEAQVEQMIEALAGAKGKALAYCRSGTRSTLLWALAQAKIGIDPETVAHAAAAAGYDVTPVRPMLDMLASN